MSSALGLGRPRLEIWSRNARRTAASRNAEPRKVAGAARHAGGAASYGERDQALGPQAATDVVLCGLPGDAVPARAAGRRERPAPREPPRRRRRSRRPVLGLEEVEQAARRRAVTRSRRARGPRVTRRGPPRSHVGQGRLLGGTRVPGGWRSARDRRRDRDARRWCSAPRSSPAAFSHCRGGEPVAELAVGLAEERAGAPSRTRA